MKKLTIFGVIFFLFLIGFCLFFVSGTQPVNRESSEILAFSVEKNEGVNQIISDLADKKLIRNRVVFYLVVRLLNLEKNLQAGNFRLTQSMDAYTIAKALSHGTFEIKLTFVEGLRKEEIAKIIAQNFGLSEMIFLSKAQEGYLFPDTYYFSSNSGVDTIIKTFTDNFNLKFGPDLKSQAEIKDLTVEQVLTLASIVEREAGTERQQVANILYKRYRSGMNLDADATVQYALGYQSDSKSWWKKNLTLADLKFDSPYNTYLNPGLPQGPISNPGLEAIKAVLAADENTPYLFYISDSSNRLHFARTLEEQNENIQKYSK